MKKWMIGLMCGLVGVTAAMGALTSPATLPMEYAGESGWTTANLDALTGWDATGLGTVYAAPNASCKFDSAGDKIIIYFDSAPGEIVYSARRSDKTALTGPYEATLQESVDTSTWTDVRSFDGSEFEGTLVTFTNALSSSSRYVKFEYITKPSGQNFGIGYVKITTGGPAVFSVSFDQPDGLTVEQGSTGVITAIPANGTGPYTYAWTTDLGASHYTAITNEFTIGATAPIGDYSAEVVATDSTSAKVTNSINFSVVAPVEKYAITITTPVNGSVTTTPATEAAAGATVTVNATPASGYAVGSIVVNGGAVAVSGTTFTMPAQAVTVTVTFAVEEAPPAGSYIVDFEGEGETKAAYASATISLNGKNWDMTEAMTGATVDSDWFNGTRSARLRGYGPSSMTMLEDLTDGLGTISFNYRRYGTDGQVDWKVEYSTDAGGSWTQIGSDFTALASDDVQTFSETVNVSGNVRVRIKRATETGTTNKRLNIDDITMTSGGPTVFGVSFDKTSGFTVETGSSATITATAVNGTPGYTYAWTTTMDAGDYSVSGAAFTIAAAATVGNYSAQVVATDNASQSVTNSLTFSVVPVATKYAITITTPVNGSVTTTPATEAAAGATVTVNATPASGYAVGSIVVNGGAVAVTGNTFTMPAQAVTVTVTFVESTTSGALIISQYYEGTSYNKWIEIYNPSASAVDLSAGEYYLGSWNNANREGWKTDVAPTKSTALTGTIAAGGTYLVNDSRATLPAYATANLSFTLDYNEDDSVVLYTGATYAFANVVDAFGLLSSTAKDKSFVRKDTITAGVNTDFNAADWDAFTLEEVEDAAESTNERIGYHSTGAAVLGVSFDKTSGFTVETGSSATITATAANGTGPYTYAWTTDLGASHHTISAGVLTILASAPVGNYSAQVVATDNASQSVTNSLTFSVVPVATKYAITITAPVNGSVTTTPATEAAAGATVTVNATPASGYAVDTIVVSGGIGTLPGTTFTMPAQPVTVTVTFMEYTAPDVLITFEDGTLPTAYAANTATLEDGKVWSTERVVRGNLENDKKIDTLSARLYPQTGTNAVLQQTEAYAEPITKLSFSVASYGTDNMANVVLTAEVSADGSTWEVVKTLTAAAEITDTLVEHVVETIPANAVYVRFVATAAAASNKRINLDNIGVDFGAATFSVSVDKSNGFTVQEGSSATITATAANGTTPYTYAWTSTLGGAYYTDAGNVFTILSTAPVGNYSATVTATDATEATTQKTVTFSVVGLPPGQPAVVITGTLTGTVGVQMALNISVTNETALDWGFVLTDPDSEPDYTTDYSGFPPVWALTPAKEGTYTLTVTATTGSGSFSNTVNLVISAASTDPEIPAITFVAGTGFTFEIPSGSALVRVEGADTTVTGQAFTWTTLASPADYEVSGSTVTIKSGAAAQRLIRVWFN
ncbi:MAG: lamin tail domain-containing protein [Kiritimatiellia bacterium]|jgi:hypothetical protein|nr:lamin tail domain-containing protein [Kiritimatiellia bacterium]